MNDTTLPVLEGVFRELLVRGMHLGLRDYLDAVRALQLDDGSWVEAPGDHGRERLRVLCQRLWARSPAELRAVDAVFALVSPPISEDVAALTEKLLGAAGEDPLETPEIGDGEGPPSASSRPSGDTADDRDPYAGVAFAPPRDAGGIPLPAATPTGGSPPTYVLEPQTVLSRRDLAVAWRRFRSLARSGARTELDFEACIHEQCRSGVLARAALRPPRRNTARLIVLADASPSMAPWRPFLEELAASLQFGRLRSAEMLYFANLPRGWLFRTAELRGRVPTVDAINRHAGASLLIISDAGAARGRFSPGRVTQSRRFLEEVTRTVRRTVWLNPMPRDRWAGSSAVDVAKDTPTAMLPLDRETLIRAVDLLRGARSA